MERNSMRFPLCTVSLSIMSASSSESNSDSLESAYDLDRAIAACLQLQSNTNSRHFTIGPPTTVPCVTTVPTDAPPQDAKVSESVSNNVSSVLHRGNDEPMSDERDWTGPNPFFASLSRHHTSVAWLEGYPGQLVLRLEEKKNQCRRSRREYHRKELEKFRDILNSQIDLSHTTSINTILETQQRAYNNKLEKDDTQIRILGSQEGCQIRTTVQIGDSKRDSLLVMKKYLDWTSKA